MCKLKKQWLVSINGEKIDLDLVTKRDNELIEDLYKTAHEHTFTFIFKPEKMKYEITEEQIKELAKGNAKVKKWYPEVFETKLEIGRWYKSIDKELHIFYVTELKDNRYYYHGFNTLGYFECSDWFSFIDCGLQKGFKPATDSEVEEALTNEAKKIGYNENNYRCLLLPYHTHKLKMNYYFNKEENSLRVKDKGKENIIFYKGKWATPIKTYTKEEAEKLLGGKIV